jgi:hypothetical protein
MSFNRIKIWGDGSGGFAMGADKDKTEVSARVKFSFSQAYPTQYQGHCEKVRNCRLPSRVRILADLGAGFNFVDSWAIRSSRSSNKRQIYSTRMFFNK